MESTAVDRRVVRELGRRRVFLFLGFFTAFFSLGPITLTGTETDTLLGAVDEYAVLILMAAIVAFILISWRKESLEQLQAQNKVILGLLVVAFVFMAYAVLQEINDVEDFRDELPSIILLVILLVNRFV